MTHQSFCKEGRFVLCSHYMIVNVCYISHILNIMKTYVENIPSLLCNTGVTDTYYVSDTPVLHNSDDTYNIYIGIKKTDIESVTLFE